ncbi:motility associated factor glycosyltransferase family protein [Candidatus Formimonas warabiya]|uniref:Motility associated factor glycosyltransferase family protein n=1 Tax=Formimonas warabiya TaxID=1761012 RepID=A0A3G1KTG4_FORW1|nr:6-hydroxymethylpterin diphosphokinase MptE-like protein [Candidatus Formimonas warabiya]ATW25684.1 hypothetical protein DCMF_13750 [Candidatus Formimonas warabiya]
MILTDNIIVLKQLNPDIWEKIKGLEGEMAQSLIKVVLSKSGLSTITIDEAGEVYLHSKYDPQNEAARFISQYKEEDLEKYEHIFFYGFGLGYHVAECMKKFPEKDFSIYEPSKEVFFHALSVTILKELPLKHLKNLFIEFQPDDLDSYLNSFVGSMNKETLLVAMPGYERCFSEHYRRFNSEFVQRLKNRKVALNINLAFEKLWTINSLMNFAEVAKTPNILHDIDKSHFKDKPAVLVSAGPSLEEELDNLKYIKEKGLAYIFAVGSAVKALVGKGISPDAVCSYDPTPSNRNMYAEVKQLKITHIPLIFGSSVYCETLGTYPGPKVHMVISQDTVAPFYLSHPQGNLHKLIDAPSIAVVTLELLIKLGCNPIILVGQNLAFRNDRWYAKGIYEEDLEKQTERVKKASLEVEDVYGGKVRTEDSLNRMRLQMEQYLYIFSPCRVINTTKGGAKIDGADFVPLEAVMKDCLTKRVVTNWLTGQESAQYSTKHKLEQAKIMDESYQECLQLLDKVNQILLDLEKQAAKNYSNRISHLFPKLDKGFKQLANNIFFLFFLLPMNRVRHDLLVNNISEMRLEKNIIEKAGKVGKSFGPFINDCRKDLQLIEPYFRDVQEIILNPESTN